MAGGLFLVKKPGEKEYYFMISHYEELIVWQKAMDLVVEVYRIVKIFPKEETYALSDQMRRAAVSIPSNIAEGQQRQTAKEFKYFLSVAKGSVAELNTQLYICKRLSYLTEEQLQKAFVLTDEVGKMLSGLISKI